MKQTLMIFALGLFLAGCGSPTSPLGPSLGCLPPLLSLPAGSPSMVALGAPCPLTSAPPAGATYGRFVRLPSIGCQNGGLAVLRSAADWAAYQGSSSCGQAAPGSMACFDFSAYTVVSLQQLACNVVCPPIQSQHIVDVAIYPTRVLVLVTDGAPGDPPVCVTSIMRCTSDTAGTYTCAPAPVPTSSFCTTEVIAIPATTRPVQLYTVSNCYMVM